MGQYLFGKPYLKTHCENTFCIKFSYSLPSKRRWGYLDISNSGVEHKRKLEKLELS